MNRSSIELRQYYRAIIKRFWLVLLFAALVMAVAYWRILAKPPAYAASGLILVTAPIVTAPATTLGGDQSSSLNSTPAMVINDIIQLISTRPVTERVAKTLGLDGPEVVQRNVRASRVRDTDLIKIRATWNDREVAAKLANTSAEVLIAHFREVNRKDAREIRRFVEQQLIESRARLNASDQAVEAYKLRHRILVLETEISQASTDTAQVRADRETAMRDLRETEARLAAAQGRLGNEQHMRLVSGTLKDNPVFQQMQTRLTDLEIQRVTLSQTHTALHPKMKALESEIITLRQRMRSVAKKVVDNEVSEANPVYDQLLTDMVSKEVDRAALLARMDALNFLERRRRMQNAQYPAVQTGMNQLVRENEVLAEMYADLSKKYQDALIRENEAGYIPAGVQVMETAVAPSISEGLRRPVQGGIAGLIGLLLGIMAAVLLETADDRIRTSTDAERALGAPVLAEVPNVAPARVAPAAATLLLLLVATVLLGGMLGFVGGSSALPYWLAQAAR